MHERGSSIDKVMRNAEESDALAASAHGISVAVEGGQDYETTGVIRAYDEYLPYRETFLA
ncbi:hypothetical protein O9K51_00294 [Purpureocillium lavendulum]|uniref:Uncharacterized protein n=1 Tax=Purpureocillium lavendulum TaxID=1247861 RepID=A0AB34G3C7_9HYPO|nr:hypothetical protein O9K51_00294 [Purpureocillium lavendulum]